MNSFSAMFCHTTQGYIPYTDGKNPGRCFHQPGGNLVAPGVYTVYTTLGLTWNSLQLFGEPKLALSWLPQNFGYFHKFTILNLQTKKKEL